jgi:hypothetical protein
MRRSTGASLALLLLAGCDERGSIGLGFDPTRFQIQSVELPFGRHADVDILFVVADSPSMAPKQAALIQALPAFAGELAMLGRSDGPRHFHLGVVTSDLGAGTHGDGECVVPGDNGLLVQLGRDAPAGCQPPSDRFIDVDQTTSTDNLPLGQDLPTTLGCLISVGDAGCAYPQALEAAYRALAGGSMANAGFLRDDALLVVAILADQDDCSAPPDSSLFDPDQNILGLPGPFRCAAAGIACGNPPHPLSADDPGPRSDCAPAPGTGTLYGLSRYSDFFFSVSGVKRNPNDVRLVLLAAPASPVQIGSDASGHPQLQPSCSAPSDASFTAQPAVRLAALASVSPRDAVTSICTAGADDFALGTIATTLGAESSAAPCLPAPIANAGDPKCDVDDENGAPLPSCAHAGASTPCWELASQPDCMPIANPRTHTIDRLALTVRPSAPPSATGRCQVLLPLD